MALCISVASFIGMVSIDKSNAFSHNVRVRIMIIFDYRPFDHRLDILLNMSLT